MANKGDGWILISIGGGLYNHPNHKEWMIDNASRLSDGTQPDDPGAPGSIAFLAGRSNVWQLDMHNVWVQCVSSGGSGGDTGGGVKATVLAPLFDSSKAYTAEDVMTRDGKLYRATEDVEAGAFDASKWEEVDVARLLDDTATGVLTKVENSIFVVDDTLVHEKLTD